MNKLTLIIPLFILLILFVFCGGKNPASGKLLNTFKVDSINVQLSGINIAAHYISVKIDEHESQILIQGLFKYYQDVGGNKVSVDYNINDWYNKEMVHLGNEVQIIGSSIYVKIVNTQRNMILKFYGKLAP